MNSKSNDPLNTRLGAAKILFHTMVDKLVGHECPHALGLVLFGERTHWFPFTRDYESFHGTLGDASADEYSTKLYDSIQFAAEKLLQFRQNNSRLLSSECKYRIFCLTDGEDNASHIPYWKVAQFLQQNQLVLDSIPLATDNEKLLKMAMATGGLTLKVVDLQKGASLFEREAVMKLCSRDSVQTIPIVNEASVSRLVATAVEDVATAAPVQIKSRVMKAADIQALDDTLNKATTATPTTTTTTTTITITTTPTDTTATTTTTTGPGQSHRRLLKEFKEIMQGPAENFQVFMTDDIQFWKVNMIYFYPRVGVGQVPG
eukprot:TRINITY_DN8238_c0_g6_i6.p1 TRINITY_DN8238_c0_g6~~TRINITY_DN8238_c0_g6_i6.p1  ORF type:complete len:317 (-),score=94.62 TRINITY_DN8238_c0_g6_i6:626-1576(-)